MSARRRIQYDPEACGAECSRCPLSGSTVVPPAGPSDADVVFVGEGPGANEIRQGEQLVGAAGVKFNAILSQVGLQRSRVFVTSALLCRPEVPGLSGFRRYEIKTYVAWLRKENSRLRKQALDQAGLEIKQLRAWIRKCEARIEKGEALDPTSLDWLEKGRTRLAALFTEMPSPLDCCSPRLWRELRWFEGEAQKRHRLLGDRPNGAVVIPAGNYAALAVVGKAGIMKLRGSPITVEMRDR